MTTTYHPLKFALTDGQKKKLQKAYASRTAVDPRIKPEQIGRGDDILLTATQINRVQKAVKSCKGVDLKLSQAQIENTAQRGGDLFSAMLGLARSLIKPALGALASAGLGLGLGHKKLNITNSSKRCLLHRKKLLKNSSLGRV